MAQASVAVLASNVSVVADQTPVAIPGGRYVVCADGTTFPTTCQPQMQMPNGSFVSIGANITAASMSAGIDLPAGQVRLRMTGGTALLVSVVLARVPY